jgi:four helix bundle protein
VVLAKGYKDLRVWEEGMALAEFVYEFTAGLPRDERWNLADQLKRAAVSVPSNIAEGRTIGTDGYFLKHVRYAQGSLAEMETQLQLAENLGLTPNPVPDDLWKRITELHKGLSALRRYLESQR